MNFLVAKAKGYRLLYATGVWPSVSRLLDSYPKKVRSHGSFMFSFLRSFYADFHMATPVHSPYSIEHMWYYKLKRLIK